MEFTKRAPNPKVNVMNLVRYLGTIGQIIVFAIPTPIVMIMALYQAPKVKFPHMYDVAITTAIFAIVISNNIMVIFIALIRFIFPLLLL